MEVHPKSHEAGQEEKEVSSFRKILVKDTQEQREEQKRENLGPDHESRRDDRNSQYHDSCINKGNLLSKGTYIGKYSNNTQSDAELAE